MKTLTKRDIYLALLFVGIGMVVGDLILLAVNFLSISEAIKNTINQFFTLLTFGLVIKWVYD